MTLLSWFEGPTPLREIIEAFASKLSLVLPSSLGFIGLKEADDEIIVATTTGDFTLDAVSGGIAAMIDLTWQIFTFAGDKETPFVVLIDEPENHLHPEMQRSVLHKLTRAFPSAQFIVSSHEPLVVTSVADARVYALVYETPANDVTLGQERVVHARLLGAFDKAGTANDVLRDVLGLEYTMPVWAAEILQDAVSDVAREGYTREALSRMDQRLRENSLEAYSVEAAAELGRKARAETGEWA